MLIDAASHPRQGALCWDPPCVPIPPVQDQRIPVEDRDKLTGDNLIVYLALRERAMTGRELDLLCGGPGSAWRTRVSNVRVWLANHATGEVLPEAKRIGPRLYEYRIERG